jgi:MFS family permease
MYLTAICTIGGIIGAIFGYRPTERVEYNWILWTAFLMGCSTVVGAVSYKAGKRRGEATGLTSRAIWDVFALTGGIFLSVLFGYVAVESFDSENDQKWQVIFSVIAIVSAGLLAYGLLRLVKNLLTILDGDVTDFR